jgi:tetratricopeptide (TPR) repeat protein
MFIALPFGITIFAAGCQPTEAPQYGHTNSEARHFETFESLDAREDLYQKVFAATGDQQQVHQKINRRLNKFALAVDRYIRDPQTFGSMEADWVSETFTGQSVRWSELKPRFKDPSIGIRRWQATKDSPHFKGDNAFQLFVEDYFGRWSSSKNFRIDLKPYSTRVLNAADQSVQTEAEDSPSPLQKTAGPRTVESKVVVEVFGNTENQVGLQATSLWTTRWRSDENETEDYVLFSVNVKAQEQIVLNSPQGQLFEDCTESILSPTQLLSQQLNYGLDQWARKIPELDIVGNHGLSIGDVNQDGLDDLYVCQPHGLPNLLLIQNPDGTVEDMGKQAGVDILDESRASLMIDVDNDGDQDLVVTTDESLVLMSNKGSGNFQLEHKLAIGHSGHSVSAADYDQDGDLDLFICKHSSVKNYRDLITIPDSFEDANSGGRNVLLRNDEGWNFVDVTARVGFGVDENSRYSRSAVWVDYDLDGDQDLYVANEWASDQLFENDRGWFQDVTENLNMLKPAQHRSVCAGEFNHDGRPDFFVATDAPLTVYQAISENQSIKKLSSAKQSILGEDQIWFSKKQKDGDDLIDGFQSFFLRAPIFAAQSAYSSVAADINNDGLDDVIVANGHLSRSSSEDLGGILYSKMIQFRESKQGVSIDGVIEHQVSENDILSLVRSGFSLMGNQRNRCYLSIGKLGFANFSSASGVDFLDDARAVATTDWDDDGDVDIVMTSRNGPRLRVMLNQNPGKNNFLQLTLVGTKSNVDAIGTRVELFFSGQKHPLVKFVTAGSGNLSQSSKRLFFGLGQRTQIEKAMVTWPNGEQQVFDDLEANTRYTVTEGDDSLAERNNERFKIAASGSQLEGSLMLPNRDVATFSPMGHLPRLEFQNEDQSFQTLAPIQKSYTTVVFFGDDKHSRAVQRHLTDMAEDYHQPTMDCVGIHIDVAAKDQQRRFESAIEFFSENEFPFRWGAATEATQEKLVNLNGQWFSHQQLPRLPFAMVLNKQGRVERFHWLTATKNPQKLVQYLNQDALKRHNRVAVDSQQDDGLWLARYREPSLLRLAERFKQLGLNDTSQHLFQLHRPYAALKMAQFATDLKNENDFERADLFFDRAIRLNPYCVPALVGRGAMITQQAHQLNDEKIEEKLLAFQRAATNFKLASKIDPRCTAAIVGRTNVLIDQNKVQEAIAELQKYLLIDPSRAEVHAILGRLYFSSRQFPEAARHLLGAYELRPNLPYVAGDLGYLYLSSGEIKLGRKFLRLANRLQPSEGNIIRHLAEAEFVNGNFIKAGEMLGLSIEMNPNKRRPKQLMAWLLATSPFEESRDGKQGRAMMESLVSMVGDRSPSTLEIYAACYAESRDFESAIEYQEKAISLVRSGKSLEKYSSQQNEGMVSRLQLYQRKRPYRMENLAQIPIKTSLKKLVRR